MFSAFLLGREMGHGTDAGLKTGGRLRYGVVKQPLLSASSCVCSVCVFFSSEQKKVSRSL